MASAENSLVRSLQRGLKIINAVAVRGPLHAKPITRLVGLPLPTTYHLLRTLVHDGYLVRLNDSTYVLGDRLGERSEPCPEAEPRRLVNVGK